MSSSCALGLLNPNAGIPICDVSVATPPRQFQWQDLVQLKFEIPMQWQDGCSFLMNQRTLALMLTMSTADGRPLLGALPQGMPGFQIAGSPITIVSQMPDCVPGATPIAHGNWKEMTDRPPLTIWHGRRAAHGAGRADFPLPVLHGRASLAVVYDGQFEVLLKERRQNRTLT